MEASQVVGVEDKCSDSESGWTMYLDSQIQNENYSEVNVDHERKGKYKASKAIHDSESESDDKSNDSMASDASSGPTQMEFSNKDTTSRNRVHRDETKNKSSWKNRSTDNEKQRDEKWIKGRKQGFVYKADSGNSKV